ncbi:hypothetical protein CLAFUW4_11774 [Fulvia fulva]|uniref:Uncharacterized protein n=1 Tax=Passalora fulva TaxID=5499 RepID=A0A9Q8PDT1_PASFU|nr:uncharacterized protein CLAFUR5_10818 [Fulvia fulva]KAK4618217.1 hypothetical protein CLAFUR4_11779 [Fulvia fulva]KAK4619056.1 hypothetical protein CLAFUR0_11792 [Fulvia fulva]UJO20582.1 hypothetical protein CLAFUR5_10818 [Fulvia fulva]WPV18032.1 hypothetical protein CLAFUW4_11774 [Fulvia fulva]WPV33172.1 hypothetical protein CLAFUW7_11781 [Fulvia fulva]
MPPTLALTSVAKPLTPRDKSPLSKLSPEMRNMIYALVFDGSPTFVQEWDPKYRARTKGQGLDFKNPDNFIHWAKKIGPQRRNLLTDVVLAPMPRCISQAPFIFDPAEALRTFAQDAKLLLDRVVHKGGVSSGVVKISFPIWYGHAEKWWTSDPVRFVEGILLDRRDQHDHITSLRILNAIHSVYNDPFGRTLELSMRPPRLLCKHDGYGILA